ncbi:UROS1 [Auxenochlorella protothecoides x Auxenochlorella symbiontica]
MRWATVSCSKGPVVLTREHGKNEELESLLKSKNIETLILPMVETAKGPDSCLLREKLQDSAFDWVCLTSPESAAVYATAWLEAGKPSIPVAVVGDGTARALARATDSACAPSFVPSVANAEHFGAELPHQTNTSARVLYPASVRAAGTLQSLLEARGFSVTRLNTYDTLPVDQLTEEGLHQAQQAALVAIASPSAIRSWVELIGQETAQRIPVACIGETSARAAMRLKLDKVAFCKEPGVVALASLIEDELSKL